VEAAICGLRRTHPRWGKRVHRVRAGRNWCPGPVPSVFFTHQSWSWARTAGRLFSGTGP